MVQRIGWGIGWTPRGLSDMAGLNRRVADRIRRKLEWLAENFDAITPEPLHGRWAGCFKLRVGDRRLVYGIEVEPERLSFMLSVIVGKFMNANLL